MLKYCVLGLSSLTLLFSVGCGDAPRSSRSMQSDSVPAAKTASPAGSVDDAAAGMGGGSPGSMSESVAEYAAEPSAEPAAEMPADSAGMGPGFGARSSRESRGDASMDAEEKFVPRSRRERQSGVLTAGSFDDVRNFTDFQSFLNQYAAGHRQSRWIPAGCQQTVITVKDEQGTPLGNARCRVTIADGQTERVLLDGTTGSDGRIMLLASHAAAAGTNGFRLQVWAPGQQQPVIDDCQVPGRRWNVSVANVASSLPEQLDLSLVIDTTGSMGDELEYLKTEIDSIVESVNQMFPHVDQRYSLITYRDNGDEYVVRSWDFTGSLQDFRRQLDQQSAAGGGDFPEAMDSALRSAGQLSWRKGNTARVMFLVGDAPPHDENIESALAAVDELREQGVRIFPVGASGVETTAQIVMRTSALLTMGQYLFLTDHSGVGNAHATPNVPEFAVERLDRLMVRMIASELAGKRLAAREIIAIENGELQTTTMHTPFSGNQPRGTSFVCVTDPYATLAVVTPLLPAHAPSGAAASSAAWSVLGWIGRHGLTVLIATVSAVMVFDNLVARGSVV